MVTRKNMTKKNILISVFDKKKLNYLCSNLHKLNYTFISTGSTYKEIKRLGYKCREISKLTNFKEILDGRVKTLNPKIYGSILYIRNKKQHLNEFKKLNMPEIDIIIVNLYPFEKISKLNNENDSIEMIDIGGPSLLRAGSKNYRYVTVISDTQDYKKLILNIQKNNNEGTDIKFRKKMAEKAFKTTSNYDKNIFNWFKSEKNKQSIFTLRYGENPGQNAYLISKGKKLITDYQINGKNISYNNIIDIDSGYRCLSEFKEPTCVIIKHGNPCGVASDRNILTAFRKAFASDPISAFGGIVLLNRDVNHELAKIISRSFFEIILAKKFQKQSQKLLKVKKNLILLEIEKLQIPQKSARSTIFGQLNQNENNDKLNSSFIKLVSRKAAPKKTIEDIVFALKVVKHVNSNSIVISKDKQTIGIGGGQTNRIDALKSAIFNMKKFFNKKNFVCVSDGFFPFTDSIKMLKKNNCNVIAQPYGSVNDDKIIEFSVQNNISLYFTKNRLFRH